MNIYLLRHGEAAPAAVGAPDSERPLSEQGERDVRGIVPGLKSLIGQIDFILTSPALRAIQTARIIAAEFKCMGFIHIEPSLAERGGEKKTTDELNRLVGKENVVVVGHSPHLAELARYLTGDESGEEIEIKKAGVLKIYIAGFPGPGEGAVRWKMSPEELKKV